MLDSVKLVALLSFAFAVRAQSGTGVTTRYWDCCKTSCAWTGKATVNSPVGSCNAGNNPLADPNGKSGCDGGSAFACADNSPWAVTDTLAYGFAAVNLSGQTEGDWCCSCYSLTFTSGPAAGKTMVVQATNTGGDVGGAQFDLMIPGGGVGAFPSGCTNQYGSLSAWGQQYGGVSSASQCSGLPAALQAGCNFRFGWFAGSDNPTVNWKKVTCPASLAARTGCVRTSEGTAADSAAATTAKTSTTTTSSKMITSTIKPATTSTTSTIIPAKPVATTTSTTTTKAATTTPKASSSTTKAAVTTVKATTSTTSTTAHQSPVETPVCSTAGSVGLAQHWGQCAGSGWTGPTTCVAPFTCQFQNAWYSQCL